MTLNDPKRKVSVTERRAQRERQIRREQTLRDQDSQGFDVTCKIGRVEPGESDLNVFEAAFVMIARHDQDGVYHFAIPSDLGATYEVSVQRHDPVRQDDPAEVA